MITGAGFGTCVSHDRNGWTVTNESYVVMPWKMVTRNGTNVTLSEAVGRILNRQESEAKECKGKIESEKKLKMSVKNIMRYI